MENVFSVPMKARVDHALEGELSASLPDQIGNEATGPGASWMRMRQRVIPEGARQPRGARGGIRPAWRGAR